MYKAESSEEVPGSSNSTFNSDSEAVIVSNETGIILSRKRVKKVAEDESDTENVTKDEAKKVKKNTVNKVAKNKEISFFVQDDANYSEDNSKMVIKSLSENNSTVKFSQDSPCVSFEEKSLGDLKKAESVGSQSVMHKIEFSKCQVPSSDISFQLASGSKANEFRIPGGHSSESSSSASARNFIPETKASQTLKENEFGMHNAKSSEKQPGSSNSAHNSYYDLVIVPTAKGFRVSAKKAKEITKDDAEMVISNEERVVKENTVYKVAENDEISLFIQNPANYSEDKNLKMILKAESKNSAAELSQDRYFASFQENSLQNFKTAEGFGNHSAMHRVECSKCQVPSSDISFHLPSDSKVNEFRIPGGQSSERRHPGSSLDCARNFIPETKASQTLNRTEFIMYRTKSSEKLPGCSNSAFNSDSGVVIISDAKEMLSKNRVKEVTKEEAQKVKNSTVDNVVKNKEIPLLVETNYYENKGSQMLTVAISETNANIEGKSLEDLKTTESFRSHSFLHKREVSVCQVSSSEISVGMSLGLKNEFPTSGE